MSLSGAGTGINRRVRFSTKECGSSNNFSYYLYDRFD